MMIKNKTIDLPPAQFTLLKEILQRHIPNKTVWAYGSRVTWRASETSDLDLAVHQCESSAIEDLREALEDSDLLVSVDVMEWEKIPAAFKENIKKKYVVIQQNNVQKGWQEISLGDLINEKFCFIKNEFREPLSSNQRQKMKGKYPYYGAAGQIDLLDSYKLEGFHLLVAEDGTVTKNGKNPMLQLVDGKFRVSNHAHILIGKSKEKTLLLYYMLNTIDINPYITGAVQPKLSKGNLLKIKLNFPPLSEQKTIAEILSSLDDKIDLLHRQNKTLEDMAQTLFHQWFVERVNNKWKKRQLGEITNFSKGRKPKRAEKKEFAGSAPQILIETFNTGNCFYSEQKGMTVANKHDILMVMDGASSGRTEIGLYGVLGSTIGLYKPTADFNYPYFIYSYLKTQEKYIKENLTGSAIPHVNKKLVESLTLRFQDLKKVIDFNNSSELLFTKKQKNIRQIRTLENLRDTLLPKLMQGKAAISAR